MVRDYLSNATSSNVHSHRCKVLIKTCCQFIILPTKSPPQVLLPVNACALTASHSTTFLLPARFSIYPCLPYALIQTLGLTVHGSVLSTYFNLYVYRFRRFAVSAAAPAAVDIEQLESRQPADILSSSSVCKACTRIGLRNWTTGGVRISAHLNLITLRSSRMVTS